uniref:ribonuclease H n=1 Tax=viral metagenome TaxID=1070528 RepID=A0A6C0C9N9_9ZZZZ
MKENLVVFTDGSCSRNGKVGAIGGIGIHFPDQELPDVSKIFNKGKCTNQRTELYAIYSALRYINSRLGLSKYNVYVKTDSKYSIDCVTNWADNWVNNGWLTKKGEPVLNREFIEEIYRYYNKYSIFMEHVDGHSDLDDYNAIGNNEADRLATSATKKAIEALMPKNRPIASGSKTNRKIPLPLLSKKQKPTNKSRKPPTRIKNEVPKRAPIKHHISPPKNLDKLIVELVPFSQYN